VQTNDASVAAARAAGLRYVSDELPGISRLANGRHFRYRNPDGAFVRDRSELQRIKTLAIPPAWTGVWIAPMANGHIQATGRDARGRKQYRYHARWREVRDETKFQRMALFARALPQIRRRVARDLRQTGLTREKVLATVVQLLETTLIRIGNEEYARQNDSYGLTTLKKRHVAVRGERLRFEFKGKSGIRHAVSLSDRHLARVVRACLDIPGQHLFAYLDDSGARQSIDSSDVNAYIREIAGEDFSAKDFRTWVGTVSCATILGAMEPFDSATSAKSNVVAAIKEVAARLGNTPAVCRKCYVHPAVVEAYQEGTLAVRPPQGERRGAGLRSEERAVLSLLEKRAGEGDRGHTMRRLRASLRARRPRNRSA